MNRDGGAMTSVTHVTETLRQILEEEANTLAKETGFLQRERIISGADFAQTLIFGWLSEPQITLDGLTQVAERREVEISASGLCQRFTQAAAEFLQRLLERLTQVRLEGEAVPVALLKQFPAVIVEDSSRIHLPDELAQVWRGCGGSQGSSRATLKLFVRWNVLSGELHGPLLADGRQADAKSPFKEQEVPAGGLYLGDQGFFAQGRLRQWHQRTAGHRRYYLMRLPIGTALYTRNGHRIVLSGMVPQQQGATLEVGVLVGKQARVPARLIIQRVPEEVAEQRRQRLRAEARDHGREPSEEALFLAGWIIVVTNVPRRMLRLAETLVVLTVRWQIELLFRLWKEGGQIDEWRSSKCWRILCEVYAKLAAMLIQHWLIELGCWHDPQRSLVKAAQVVRREAGQLMVAMREGRVEQVVQQILRCMRSGCRIEKRKQFPSTVQRLEGAPMLGGRRPQRPQSSRHRDQCRRWPAGKGWATSKPGNKTKTTVSSLT
jgi:Transposase DDE domain